LKIYSTIILTLTLSLAAHSTEFRVTNYIGKSKYTNSGHKVKMGLCAADWKIYPPGTIIQLTTGERLIVADTGGSVKGSKKLDRYNPHPKSRFYPQTSRGVVIHRGDPRGSHNLKIAYASVKKAFVIKEQFKKKAMEKKNARKKGFNNRSRNIRPNGCLRIIKSI